MKLQKDGKEWEHKVRKKKQSEDCRRTQKGKQKYIKANKHKIIC
jgi:hypothetical protein